MKSTRSIINAILISCLFFIPFIIITVVASMYEDVIISNMKDHIIFGEIIYLFMASLAVIIPIISNMMLIPIGSVLFGPLMSSVLCIVGWGIGSIVAFYIGAKYRDFLLSNYPTLKKYTFIDTLISKKHPYLSLIFLRMTFPVDVLSYAFSIFSTKISWKDNAITTFIGIIPFAFIFSYFGTMSIFHQVILIILTTILMYRTHLYNTAKNI